MASRELRCCKTEKFHSCWNVQKRLNPFSFSCKEQGGRAWPRIMYSKADERRRSGFPCLASNSHPCHTRVISFLFYPTARLRRVDSSHSGQHCGRHNFDFCCPHKVPAEQDSGRNLMEQMCLSKQKCMKGRNGHSLGGEMCLCVN